MKTFIFDPGEWLGHGTINFGRVLPYQTKWKIQPIKDDQIVCVQTVALGGEKFETTFVVLAISDSRFDIQVERQKGKGTYDADNIYWKWESGHTKMIRTSPESYDVKGENSGVTVKGRVYC